MAKITFRDLPPDDPIFTGRFSTSTPTKVGHSYSTAKPLQKVSKPRDELARGPAVRSKPPNPAD
jgi:hypothetical protein